MAHFALDRGKVYLKVFLGINLIFIGVLCYIGWLAYYYGFPQTSNYPDIIMQYYLTIIIPVIIGMFYSRLKTFWHWCYPIVLCFMIIPITCQFLMSAQPLLKPFIKISAIYVVCYLVCLAVNTSGFHKTISKISVFIIYVMAFPILYKKYLLLHNKTRSGEPKHLFMEVEDVENEEGTYDSAALLRLIEDQYRDLRYFCEIVMNIVKSIINK